MTEQQPPQPTTTPDAITEHEMPMPMVAVDLDGTLASYDGWGGLDEFGTPRDGAASFMQSLIDAGNHVVVYTTRTNPQMPDRPENVDPIELIEKVEEWLNRNAIPFHEVWSGPGKPPASAFVDDRAVNVPTNPYPEDYARALEIVMAMTRPTQPPAAAAQQQPAAPPSGVPQQ